MNTVKALLSTPGANRLIVFRGGGGGGGGYSKIVAFDGGLK